MHHRDAAGAVNGEVRAKAGTVSGSDCAFQALECFD